MEQHLTQYRIFYAVARAGNISRAAKELFISQPAISKSISKLEESLGMALLSAIPAVSPDRRGTGLISACGSRL